MFVYSHTARAYTCLCFAACKCGVVSGCVIVMIIRILNVTVVIIVDVLIISFINLYVEVQP